MKLLEFLEVIREDDRSSEPGKFVGARLTRESERQLMHWMRETGLRKKQPRSRLHITVIGDPTRNFDWTPATFDPPLEVDASSYKLKRFGGENECVVLVFSCPELEARHHKARKEHGVHWDHEHYQPHITISVDPTGLNNIDDLLLPTFPLYVKNEYEQPWVFNANESESTERRRVERTDESILIERNLMNAPWAKEVAEKYATDTFAGRGGFPDLPHIAKWASKALTKYLINEYPAAIRINSFEPWDDQNTDRPPMRHDAATANGEIVGRANVSIPRATQFGIVGDRDRDMQLMVPKWALKSLERGDELYFLDTRAIQGTGGIPQQTVTVRDWLRSLVRQQDPVVMEPGRMNRMSWAQALQSAQQWHAEMTAGGSDIVEDPGHKELYLDLGSSGQWWELTGPTCLTREGDLMGHCVADYIDQVESGESIIYSLRDKKNEPHVTVEVSPFTNREHNTGIAIEQVKGKENKPPVKKYWPQVIELLKKLNQEYPEVRTVEMGEEDLGAMGIFKVPNGGPFIRVTNKHEGEDDPLKWRIKVRRDYLTKDDNDDVYPGDYNSTVGKFARNTYDSPYTVIANIAYHGEHKTEGVIEDETAESMYAWSDEVIA